MRVTGTRGPGYGARGAGYGYQGSGLRVPGGAGYGVPGCGLRGARWVVRVPGLDYVFNRPEAYPRLDYVLIDRRFTLG